MSALMMPVRTSHKGAAVPVVPAARKSARARPSYLRLVTPDFVPGAAPRTGLSFAVTPVKPAEVTSGLRWRSEIPAQKADGARELVSVRPASPRRRVVVAAPAQAKCEPVRVSSLPEWLRVLVLGALTVVAVVLAGCAGVVTATVMSGPVQTTTTVVQSGQTLWDVAEATGAPDVAETVAQIQELNGLQGSELQPGQTLLVPVG